MTRRPRWAWLAMALCIPAPAEAQLSELHFGGVGSYTTGSPYQWGTGATVSYAPGRLAYMGLRWIYYFGSTETAADATGTYEVTNRAQLFGADLGLQFPLGALEVVTGMTLGAVRFSQQTAPVAATTAPPETAIGTEFVVAPVVMVQIRVGPLMLVPQLAYYVAGAPDLRWPVDHNGFAVSLFLVVPIETDRIRY